MNKVSRKWFLQQLIAAGASAPLVMSRAQSTAAPETSVPLEIPFLPLRWTEATQILGNTRRLPPSALVGKRAGFDRTPLYNDFCITEGSDGRWHCIGILFEGHSIAEFRQDRLFHYVADALTGPYRSVGPLDFGYGKHAGVWAPCAVREGARTLLFYAHRDKSEQMSIRAVETDDVELKVWRPWAGGKAMFPSEDGNRDPEIIKDGSTGQYLMYYVCEIQLNGNWTGVVRARTSTDLINWSEPRTALGTPPGYGSPESVFVLQRNGYYYMWVSSALDYALMSLYVSMDPFSFGDAVASRVDEQFGHACEVVEVNGHFWMGCVAIASVPGINSPEVPHHLPLAQHDLEGVWIQPIAWRSAATYIQSKVTNRPAFSAKQTMS
jgi:hypothetical protein